MSRLRSRFDGQTSEDMERYGTSIQVDMRMADEDIDGSIAHATMLGEVGLLSLDEAETLRENLEVVRADLKSGRFEPSDLDEDIHMAVEARLVTMLGEVGKKLHTARSRNDQVATDVRLWLKRRLTALDHALVTLLEAVLQRVEGDGRALMPGFTHLQRGQPILLGHQLLAHAWPLLRDRERLQAAHQRLDRSPLGACAMAGTPHPIDPLRSAELLGFVGPVENAMDAVSARDHAQEVAAACAICMTHLSRMAGELVLWSTSEFRFVTLGETYATGSSIMPQKRNPDAAELMRGKAARVQSDVQALLTLTHGMPLSYNRDLQEDRRPLFDAVDTTLESVSLAAGMWRTVTFDTFRFEDELWGDFSLATELADYLVEQGIAFREAHAVVGRIVRWCDEERHDLRALDASNAGDFHEALVDADFETLLDPRAAAQRRTSHGGTAWSEIERQVQLMRRHLPGDEPG